MSTQEDDLLIYNDDEAVEFIKKLIPIEFKERINDDIIDYVMDVVYEFYEQNGLINEDEAEEAVIDEEVMMNFVLKCAKKDAVEISDEEIMLILDAEFEYGKSVGIYNEE